MIEWDISRTLACFVGFFFSLFWGVMKWAVGTRLFFFLDFPLVAFCKGGDGKGGGGEGEGEKGKGALGLEGLVCIKIRNSNKKKHIPMYPKTFAQEKTNHGLFCGDGGGGISHSSSHLFS